MLDKKVRKRVLVQVKLQNLSKYIIKVRKRGNYEGKYWFNREVVIKNPIIIKNSFGNDNLTELSFATINYKLSRVSADKVLCSQG